MDKIIVFVLAGVGGFFAVSSFSVSSESDLTGQMASGEMRACMRQMAPLMANESLATSACNCVYEEFGERDMTLLDAFGSDFEEMSRVTRSCAAKYGAALSGG